MAQDSVAVAKTHLSELIDRALDGEGVVVTRHGRPAAELRAVQPGPRPMTAADLEWLAHRRLPCRSLVNAGDFVSRMRDEDDER